MIQMVLYPGDGDWSITAGVYCWADRAMFSQGGGPRPGNAGEKKNPRAKKKKKKSAEIRKHL
jgi:hypothetical protein